MHLKDKINAFISLGHLLGQMASNNSDEPARAVLEKAEAANGWFTRDNIQFALHSWAGALTQEKLQKWLSAYAIDPKPGKTVAIVMAGNVPLVGFHDFLSVLVSGNKVLAKLSSNDKILLPYIAEQLVAIEPRFKDSIAFTEGKLAQFDAVIATGSNNTARYFDYYFGKYPHIIRKNRNSVAVLTGTESVAELRGLADDIFRYFGLGCRNVSKLYVPENYDFTDFFKAMYSWKHLINHHKYINNYDYNKAVYLMDGLPLLDNEFMVLKKDSGLSSPISVVFYENYGSIQEVSAHLNKCADQIQCLVSNVGIDGQVPFGKAQNPELWDYADGVDTVDFLLKLPE